MGALGEEDGFLLKPGASRETAVKVLGSAASVPGYFTTLLLGA